ncbi:MAG: nucleotidyltransferase [Sphaerobacteraceae bacterium]|nr:MAG: nucleotidyltransferase [Sphaerobacteraceae bacterium]
MNIIIPVAGLGKRLRPHTWSRPKPLVSVAGKPMLGHVLDRLLTVPVERVVFVTGYLGDQIEDHVRANYDFDVDFVEQTVPRGQSDAIIRARGKVTGETLVVFPDMLFEVDLNEAIELSHDGALFVKEVDDPRKFGVVVKDGDLITRLVEKPQEPVSNEAVIGIYYFKNIEDLFDGIDYQMENDLQKDGEFFIADAIQYMIDQGKSITTLKASVWEDCGSPEALLHTNRYLLDNFGEAPNVNGNNVILPPVVIDPSAQIEGSVIGPHASIGANVEVRDSIVRDSIVDNGAEIETAMLTASIVGREALVTGDFMRVNAGDSSDILLAAHARDGRVDNG